MTESIIGRKDEQQILERVYQSKGAEFVAVYGRRRVGKTFLIRQFFTSKKCLFFQISGIQNAPQKTQLLEFTKELQATFYATQLGTLLEPPKDWMQALAMLHDAITLFAKKKKVILFFDEFPWLAIKKYKLLQSVDYFWNRHWVDMPNVKLIICGSAASWIINNILNNKGGLHNRVTTQLPIEPFNLQETKNYLKQQGVHYNNDQIVELYLCLGGIPYYLKLIKKSLSAIQNINALCFQKRGGLSDEFQNLFASLFNHAQAHTTIIKLIALKREGIKREEIEKAMDNKGGRLSVWLQELEQAGFITSYFPYDKNKGLYYKVIDEYTLFYLTWVAPDSKNRIKKELNPQYWKEIAHTPAWNVWAGYAYEALCFKHIESIRHALHIPVGSIAASWQYHPKKNDKLEGAQIDLLFDRQDGIIHLCEIKCNTSLFVIDKDYAHKLLRKIDTYRAVTKTEKQIFMSMITYHGLKKNIYSEDLINSIVTVDDFFKEKP